jgi:hypothetical protein
MDREKGINLIEIKNFPSLKNHTIQEIAERGYHHFLTYQDGGIRIQKETHLYC